MSDAPDLVPFSSDHLYDFRRLYLRDYWDGATGLSRFNQANKQNFFDDDDLLGLEAKTREDFAEELAAQWTDKREQRVSAGDDEATANAIANRAQLDARYRLLEAECLERMMADPGIRASLIVGKTDLSPTIFKEWVSRIERNRMWARSRAGEYAMISLERM